MWNVRYIWLLFTSAVAVCQSSVLGPGLRCGSSGSILLLPYQCWAVLVPVAASASEIQTCDTHHISYIVINSTPTAPTKPTTWLRERTRSTKPSWLSRQSAMTVIILLNSSNLQWLCSQNNNVTQSVVLEWAGFRVGGWWWWWWWWGSCPTAATCGSTP